MNAAVGVSSLAALGHELVGKHLQDETYQVVVVLECQVDKEEASAYLGLSGHASEQHLDGHVVFHGRRWCHWLGGALGRLGRGGLGARRLLLLAVLLFGPHEPEDGPDENAGEKSEPDARPHEIPLADGADRRRKVVSE